MRPIPAPATAVRPTTAVHAAQKVGEDYAPRTQERLVQVAGNALDGGKALARQLQTFSDRHQVSARVSAAGQTLATATSAGVAKTREFNEKHQITDRVAAGAVAAAANVRKSAASFDEKHHVAEKVGGWFRKARESVAGR